jgi:S-adenosylmethionine uptake transporter
MNRAIAMALVSMALLSVMDALIKQFSIFGYPTFQNVFLRFAFASIVAIAVFLHTRPQVTAAAVKANVLRSIIFVISSVLFFFGLAVLPLAEVVALAFLAPLFMALFATLFLKERIGPTTLVALAVGFAGMLVMVGGKMRGDALSRETLGAYAAVFASAIVYALSMVWMRARATVDPPPLMVAIQNIVPVIVLAGPAAQVWVPPTPMHWALFALAGVIGIAGHFLLVGAFARAEAAKIAPLEYSHLVWAIILGYVWFGEVPGLATILGAAMIVGATWIAGRR